MKSCLFKFLYLLTLLLIPGSIFSQNGIFWFNYESELEKRLNPVIDTITTKEVVFFKAKPSFIEPEHSIRIIEFGNQTFIEARILERNLWTKLSELTKQNDSLLIKTYLFVKPVSISFRNKMIIAFSKVIVLDTNTIKRKEYESSDGTIHGVQIFDGTTYEFITNSNGVLSKAIIRYELNSSDFRWQVINTNLEIINDLKNDLFNESKYDF